MLREKWIDSALQIGAAWVQGRTARGEDPTPEEIATFVRATAEALVKELRPESGVSFK